MKRPAPRPRPPGARPKPPAAAPTSAGRTPPNRPSRPGPGPGPGRTRPERPGADLPTRSAADRAVVHVSAPEVIAEAAAEVALTAERAVLQEGKRADRVISAMLKARRDLAAPDHRFISGVAFALFRWKGWIDPLDLRLDESRLLLSTLLDSATVHPACRVWARMIGRDPNLLTGLGDAPSWAARAEGLRRLLGGQAVTGDPWALFPNWLREHLPLPPGDGPPKSKFVRFLQSLQTPAPLWLRAQGKDEARTWDELKALGVKPWIHRVVGRAAKVGPEVDVYHLAPFTRGELEIQDIASQAVAIACDPDPGDRWWDACAGAGGKSLHLATLMGGRGFVLATDVSERALKETVRRARRGPNRNLSTKPWDGRHVPAKPASFDGVLVDAPCSAIGTWRRNPDARMSTDREAVGRLATLQRQILDSACAGVKPGGTLVYSVCTLTIPETRGVVDGFLADHPEYTLDPFPHPLTGEPTDGMLLIWPQESDSDSMFIARMVRST